jgi:hypothetical protein
VNPGNSVRVVAGVAVAAFVLACSGCGSPAAAPPTSIANGAPASSVYPPIPKNAPGFGTGCAGVASTGMSAQKVQQVITYVTSTTTSGQISQLSGCTGGPVLLGLTPGEERLARQLGARFGSDLHMTVGLTSYAGKPGRSPLCGSLEPSAPLPAGLHLALELNSRNIRSGATFNGKVVVDEQGPGSYLMDTGQPLQAVVVRSGTLQVVGVFSLGIAGTGYLLNLAPGHSGSVPIVGGTARCDGDFGSALSPGNYQVIVRVAPETSPQTPAYLTPGITIHVIRS